MMRRIRRRLAALVGPRYEPVDHLSRVRPPRKVYDDLSDREFARRLDESGLAPALERLYPYEDSQRN